MSFPMKPFQFAILTFCIHQIAGQDNVRSGDFARRLQDDSAINFNSNTGYSQQKLLVEDTPDEFAFKRPSIKDKPYDDFLSFLYRRDKAKSKVKREIKSGSTVNGDVGRGKRMIVFRLVIMSRIDR